MTMKNYILKRWIQSILAILHRYSE